MIVAVLKNRLLQLTNRTFREEDFGATSLVELMTRYRDLVAIDRSVRPIVISQRASVMNSSTAAT